MIRWLQSDLFEDFWQEIRQVEPDADRFTVPEKINPSLMLKFSQLAADDFAQIEALCSLFAFPNWTSQSAVDNSIMISFPNREAVRKLMLVEHDFTDTFRQELTALLNNMEKRVWNFKLPSGDLRIDRPLVMGILNVTPDSFSDGGEFLEPERAFHHAMKLVEAGADIIDIGAESTRPGAKNVVLEEEWRRIQPVLRQIRRETKIPLSIDTYKSEIARRAIAEEVDIVNDISGLTFDPRMAEVAADAGVPVVLMHIQGTPRDMQKNPQYGNMMEEIFRFLKVQVEYAESSGIHQIVVDPGLGFGKRFEDNFELIRRLAEFRALGWPVLSGPSRKSFIGKILDKPADQRLMGSAACTALSIANGASIVRVHDVADIVQLTSVAEAIQKSKA